jgi:hypothetical protein
MKFRLGVVIGFGAGYYLGAMAGRERYEQLNRMVKKVKRSDAFEEAADKAKAAVDLGVERAKDFVDARTHGDTNGSGPKIDKSDLQGAPTPY